jgi:CRP/FNR family cyclic AMP-dependent transcriptional regulator
MDEATHNQLLNLLADAGVSARARAETLTTLLVAAHTLKLPAGRNICHRGEAVDAVVFVLEGKVEVSICTADGKRSILWFIGPGQAINLIPVIDGLPAIHDFRTHTPVVGASFPRTALLAAIDNDPGFGRALLGILCARSRTLYDHLAVEGLLSLQSRVARVLSLMIQSHGKQNAEGIVIELKLAQDELADMLGITRQSLNRELKLLEQLGAIALAYARIVVRDEAQLRQLMNWEGAGAP